MNTIRIVPARADSDFAAIANVYYRTWLATYPGMMPDAFLTQLTPSVWHPEQRWQQTFLAMTGTNQIVGVCSFGPARRSEYSGWGELYSIYVLPEWHHQGLGRRLIRAALAQLASFQRVYLVVLAENKGARQFYRNYDFVNGPRIISKVPGGVLNELVMTKTMN